jgi:hypothetical protein
VEGRRFSPGNGWRPLRAASQGGKGMPAKKGKAKKKAPAKKKAAKKKK